MNGPAKAASKTSWEKEKMLVTTSLPKSNFNFLIHIYIDFQLKFLIEKKKKKMHNYLTHYHTKLHFDTLKIYSYGKHCEKMRNCM